jgi:hypothetical protein
MRQLRYIQKEIETAYVGVTVVVRAVVVGVVVGIGVCRVGAVVTGAVVVALVG